MTQATQLISLQLTAMDLMATAPQSMAARSGAVQMTMAQSLAAQHLTETARTGTGTQLTLEPGLASEMLVQLRNTSDRALNITWQLDGDFPQDWCRLGTEGSELPPGHQMEGVLYFAMAPDFFEHPRTAEQLPIRLDYQGQLSLQAIEPRSGHSETARQSFSLYVRPHSLYPRFLPDIYRNIDFVGRFLKIFEETFEPTVNALDSLWAYLDPLTAPEAMLPFLAHWVGWEFQGPLTLEQQRLLIRYALQIYRWRGTRRGLRFYLHLATGLPLDEHCSEGQKSIGIHESFSQGCVFGLANLGEDAVLGGSRPLHFTVCLRPPSHQVIDQALVHQILAQEKPAFCHYDLRIAPRNASPDIPPDPPLYPARDRPA